MDRLSPVEVGRELRLGREVLARYTHDPAVGALMRPPHGRFTEATIRAAQQNGYDVILWNDDAGDWRYVPPQDLAVRSAAMTAHILRNATAPEIVLLHSGQLATIEALPEVVRRFRAAGYRFVTVGEMLRDVPIPEINHPLKRAVEGGL